MSFPKSNIEKNFSTYVFGKVILTLSRTEKWMLDIATYIMQKNIKLFNVWSLAFLEKSEICMKLTFSRGHYNKHADWKRPLCV